MQELGLLFWGSYIWIIPTCVPFFLLSLLWKVFPFSFSFVNLWKKVFKAPTMLLYWTKSTNKNAKLFLWLIWQGSSPGGEALCHGLWSTCTSSHFLRMVYAWFCWCHCLLVQASQDHIFISRQLRNLRLGCVMRLEIKSYWTPNGYISINLSSSVVGQSLSVPTKMVIFPGRLTKRTHSLALLFLSLIIHPDATGTMTAKSISYRAEILSKRSKFCGMRFSPFSPTSY